MPASVGERARLRCEKKKAPSGWDAANFLVAEARTALCLIHRCYAFDQRQEGFVQLNLLEGTDKFTLKEAVFQEPIVPVLVDRDLDRNGRSHHRGEQLGIR